ncbi:hypothetical protein [Paenibacillus polymyxa]|uniref:Uncharacterized protein n=1 Tax=Paenibacillus polymyxa (strain SC2) TaxID=886882 RepID=E3EJP4_PAEPS|nr:hypothetical protein [Paenibacillus polymyxa]ADO59642.1 hypothetical protein PPSC2_26925 [Paenibacillus polymyxa SC2]WPQ59532.1 hypothetical protein SKN87_28120 [Paenibacillus polymyxa]
MMNRKQLQEWLNQFPEEAIVCTDTNNHYSTDGIRYGTMVECGDENNKLKLLFIGNTRHVGKLIDGEGRFENHEYNLKGLRLLNAVYVKRD